MGVVEGSLIFACGDLMAATQLYFYLMFHISGKLTAVGEIASWGFAVTGGVFKECNHACTV
jgi:hypothetical protein